MVGRELKLDLPTVKSADGAVRAALPAEITNHAAHFVPGDTNFGRRQLPANSGGSAHGERFYRWSSRLRRGKYLSRSLLDVNWIENRFLHELPEIRIGVVEKKWRRAESRLSATPRYSANVGSSERVEGAYASH